MKISGVVMLESFMFLHHPKSNKKLRGMEHRSSSSSHGNRRRRARISLELEDLLTLAFYASNLDIGFKLASSILL